MYCIYLDRALLCDNFEVTMEAAFVLYGPCCIQNQDGYIGFQRWQAKKVHTALFCQAIEATLFRTILGK